MESAIAVILRDMEWYSLDIIGARMDNFIVRIIYYFIIYGSYYVF